MPQLAATTDFINQHLAGQWKKHHLTPAPRCTDEAFLRRATLDVVGRIPTPEEVQAFVADNAADKRSKLIDRLLASEAYGSYWARTWASWLLPRTVDTLTFVRLGPPGILGTSHQLPGYAPFPGVYREQLTLWLNEQFAKNASYKQLAEELLTATGKNNDNGATNFILANLGTPTPASRQAQDGAFDMVPITARSVRLFLGYQIHRAQFEDDPINADWKQKHFWGVNTFFRQVERIGQPLSDPARQAGVLALQDNPGFNAKGLIFYEKPNAVPFPSEPIFLDGRRIPQDRAKLPRRVELARLMTTHPNFNRAAVSRMWGQFFGRGFHSLPAADDFGAHNELLLPELLDRVAADFAAAGNDLKQLVRWICTSDAYQLQSVSNATNLDPKLEVYLSRMPVRLLSPEQFAEALLLAVQPRTAVARQALQRHLVGYFGQRFDGNEWADLPPADKLVYLHRFLGRQEVTEVLTLDSGTLRKAALHPQTAKGVEFLYRATLTRPPSDKETAALEAELAKELNAGAKDVQPVWQDLFWALLNSSEFILNH